MWYLLFFFIALVGFLDAIELTFELPDNENQCFHEDIQKGTESTVEYQVVTGGQNDVDMQLHSPSGVNLYKGIRKQYDSFTWTADVTGGYKVCFSNEFSTFTHKVVYMDWTVGKEKQVVPRPEDLRAMTLLESTTNEIHEKLKQIDDYQTHHRLREATGRRRAEDLNERVLWWSIGQSVVLLIIGIGQVKLMSIISLCNKTRIR
ncbi:unnamed protein product [Soboliphyme baturini]|uniref:GOLD domain-containing protein n=1 Tax=Soboliphyme baturini TaxID=241478 RepID=A0A183IXX1_9BILA|nr:unnamed protein product [Soboliphyme baturini]